MIRKKGGNMIPVSILSDLGKWVNEEHTDEMFHSYCARIAKRLLGKREDFSKYSLRFKLADDSVTNNAAFIIEPDENGIYYIEINKGLLKNIETEDMLAFVIGHELTHFRLDRQGKTGSSSKLEEGLADAMAIEQMAEAGYDPKEAYKFRSMSMPKRQRQFGEYIASLRDEHLMREDNLFLIEAKLTQMNQDEFSVSDMHPTPISDELKNLFLEGEYSSFANKIQSRLEGLSFEDALEEVKTHSLHLAFSNRVTKQLFDSLNDLAEKEGVSSEVFDEKMMDYVVHLMDEELDLSNYDKYKYGYLIPEIIRRISPEGLKNNISKIYQTKYIQNLRRLMTDFINVTEEEKASRLATEILDIVEATNTRTLNKILTPYLSENLFPCFEIEKKASSEQEEIYAPWNKFLPMIYHYTQDGKNTFCYKDREIRDLLLLMGVFDYRIAQSDRVYYIKNELSKPQIRMPEGSPYLFDFKTKDLIRADGSIQLGGYSLQAREEERNKYWIVASAPLYASKLEQAIIREKDILDDVVQKEVDLESSDLNKEEYFSNLCDLKFFTHKDAFRIIEGVYPAYLETIMPDEYGKYFENPELLFQYNQGDKQKDAVLFEKIKLFLPHLKNMPQHTQKKCLEKLFYVILQTCEKDQQISLVSEIAKNDLFPHFDSDHQLMLLNQLDHHQSYTDVLKEVLKTKKLLTIEDLDSELEKLTSFHQNLISRLDKVPICSETMGGVLLFSNRASVYRDDKENISLESFEKSSLDTLTISKGVLLLSYLENKKEAQFDLMALMNKYNGSSLNLFQSHESVNPITVLRDVFHSRKILERFVENEENWPKDIEERIKLYVFLKKNALFPENRVFECAKIREILKDISLLPLEKQEEYLSFLLVKKGRIPDPEMRQTAIDLWTSAVANLLGQDDGSNEYLEKLKEYIEPLRKIDQIQAEKETFSVIKQNAINRSEQGLVAEDAEIIMSSLANKILSQRAASFYLEPVPSLSQLSFTTATVTDTIAEALFQSIAKFPDKMELTIDFLINPLTPERQEKYFQELFEKARFPLNMLKEKLTPQQMGLFYENFWASSLQVRTLMMKRMVDSKKKDDEGNWQAAFDFVFKKMFEEDNGAVKKDETELIRTILKSYVSEKGFYEREFILAAMLTASHKEVEGETISRGKALRLFLEKMGPSEVKLGQAIASFPGTPLDIKEELQNLKGDANPPSRWQLFKWMDSEMNDEYQQGVEKLGKLLGSASYYVTTRVHKKSGESKVVGFLRPKARQLRLTDEDRAHHIHMKSGFYTLYQMSQKLSSLKKEDAPSLTSDSRKTLQILGSHLSRLIEAANNSSKNELDMQIGAQQAQIAHEEIYGGKVIDVDGFSFNIESAKWDVISDNFKEMSEVKGMHFNDLPDGRQKKAVAMAYLTLELGQILSGRPFDHDRHGAQLKVNLPLQKIGIFDNGALMMHYPTGKEKEELGRILGKSYSLSEKQNISIAKAFEEVVRSEKAPSEYVLNVQKGLLALQDFMSVLSKEELKQVLLSTLYAYPLDPKIKNGFLKTAKIPFLKKIALKTYLAFNGLFKKAIGEPSVKIRQGSPEEREPTYQISRPKPMVIEDIITRMQIEKKKDKRLKKEKQQGHDLAAHKNSGSNR